MKTKLSNQFLRSFLVIFLLAILDTVLAFVLLSLIELQRKMYVTMCGSARKISKTGEEYGWPSTAFCTVEKFFGKEIMEEAGEIDAREAVDVITRQVYRLNPSANPRKVQRFIRG